MAYVGPIGDDLTEPQGIAAAQIVAMNVIAQIDHLLEARWKRFDGLLRVEGYIASADDWSRHIVVLDAASDIFCDVLGERGRHARAAFIAKANLRGVLSKSCPLARIQAVTD